MKKLYSIIMKLVLMATALSITACGGNDEESRGQENPSSFGKRLIRVTSDNYTKEYFYDSEGRVIQIERTNNSTGSKMVVEAFEYDDNSIVETIFDDGFSYQKKYTLENGKIKKIYDGDTKNSFEYNYKNGYLITETKSNQRKLDYYWTDGNLMRVEYENERTIETYEYTNYICPQGFFPFGRYADICRLWGLSGLLGKTMKNLPSKYTGDEYTEIYDWLIQDGLPIMLICTYNEKNRYNQRAYKFDWL